MSEYRQYERVALSNGITGVLIEVLGDGAAYLFERDGAEYIEDVTQAQFIVHPDDIAFWSSVVLTGNPTKKPRAGLGS